MGPENSSAPMVAYINGQPVEIGRPLTEITPDYSAGGISAEGAVEAAGNMAAAMAGVSITMEVAAEGIQGFFRAMELSTAIWLARTLEPELFHRYLHTKKKRTRKKYEKRIMAWFREVLG